MTCALVVPAMSAQGQRQQPLLTIDVPYVDAKPLFDSLRDDLLPVDLRGKSSAERESAWPGWVRRRDADIRGRLARGDEDSIVNFLLFGTTFSRQPRIRYEDVAALKSDPLVIDAVRSRLDDMVAGIASPATNERLQFARELLEKKGINATTPKGQDEAQRYLAQILVRAIQERREFDAINKATQSALITHSSLYRDRGLSSDTSIFVNYGIERVLDIIKSRGGLADASVGRVALVGPGLDFADKYDGYDFYPLQTIQPFAVIDSLIRLGLAAPGGVALTTIDLNARITQHLEAVRQRAVNGEGYVVQLTRDPGRQWTPRLEQYWQRLGDRIGENTAAAAPPEGTNIQVRAVRVRPSAAMSMVPQDVNVVLQRLETPTPGDRFDLIISTNVLIYYDLFEQSLALANVMRMLRPGGLFLSNDLVADLPTNPMTIGGRVDVPYTTKGEGDQFVWYHPR